MGGGARWVKWIGLVETVAWAETGLVETASLCYFLTQVCAIVFIFYEGNQYPIIFQGSVITFIDIQKGLKIIIIVKSFFR